MDLTRVNVVFKDQDVLGLVLVRQHCFDQIDVVVDHSHTPDLGIP